MKRLLLFLKNQLGKKKTSYSFSSFTYKAMPTPTLEQLTGPVSEDFMKNFAMIIPKEAIKINEMVEDPRGAPVYASCPSKGGLCACTGACRRIIEYTKDPVKLSAHRQYIANYNSFQKSQMQNFNGRWETKKD